MRTERGINKHGPLATFFLGEHKVCPIHPKARRKYTLCTVVGFSEIRGSWSCPECEWHEDSLQYNWGTWPMAGTLLMVGFVCIGVPTCTIKSCDSEKMSKLNQQADEQQFKKDHNCRITGKVAGSYARIWTCDAPWSFEEAGRS